MTDRAMRVVTLTDVAHAAGVSLATASRVLNGGERRVRDDLRQRVMKAAIELEYSVNAQAQAMARGRTNVVGLLVHDIADPYFSAIATGLMRAAEEHRLVVTIVNTGRRPEKELEYLSILRGQRCCAVVLAGSRWDDPEILPRLNRELTAFEATGGKAVMISERVLPFDTVQLENRAGARILAEDLVGLGYEDFRILAAPSAILTSRARVQGFRQGLERMGIKVAKGSVIYSDFTRDGGYEAMSRLLDDGYVTGCVFAASDMMAVGAMAACRDRGVQLPQAMAIAGFGDIAMLRDITPGLSTVRLPLEEVGSAALEFVVAPRGSAPRMKRIRGEVMLRESTPGGSR